MKKVWYQFAWWYPFLFIAYVNSPCHALGHCFNPYNGFHNLHILSLDWEVLKPRGISMYTSSSKSPCKNTYLTSTVTIANHNLLSKTINFPSSQCQMTEYYFATNLVWYESILPAALCLRVNIHLQLTGFFLGGRDTILHMPFFYRSSISTYIISTHFWNFSGFFSLCRYRDAIHLIHKVLMLKW